MQSKSRETYLKLGVGIVVGLFVLDRMILGPAIESWKSQGERLGALRTKVERGRTLMEREKSIRARWGDMRRGDLSDDHSEAENDVFKAIGRWASASRVSFTSLTPQWRDHEGGYDTFECRAQASGSQEALGRLLYEIESDPLPMRIEECEISTRDAKGAQLALSVRFSAVRINDTKGKSR